MPHVLPRVRKMVRPESPMAVAVLALTAVMTLARAVEAGPPLICHPFQTGSAPLLPWGAGTGWNTPDPAYDVQRLTADTMRLLTPDAPILSRMENLRRATIYAARDPKAAASLRAAVLDRVLAAAAEGQGDPLAWFDAGYLVESYRQADLAFHRGAPSRAAASDGLRGHRLVEKAIELTGANPEMEYAASLMEGPAAAEHRRRATSGAKAGSPLARNLSQ